jgi:L-amino acid N-acyltransferase YncA/putative methionine-R-sulfoxide reductase with GAF domain
MALVRTIEEQDVDTITRIYAHYVRHSTATFEIEPPGPSEMDRRRLEILSQRLPYFVAEMDGVVVGYAYARPYRPRPAYQFTVEDSIYIHPDFLARGLGRLLLTKLIEFCETQGSRQMIAIIGDSGNAASIRLHAAFGFHTVGVLQGVGRKFGRWVDTVIMQRALQKGGVLSEVKRVVERQKNRAVALQQIADLLRQDCSHRWVGLYEVNYDANEVRNLVFSGPSAPTFPVFPIDQGLTGTTIRERRTVNIGDVTTDGHYLTALGTTRSEIIVPIFNHARNAVVGTIDVESEHSHAFPDEVQLLLEDAAEAMSPLWHGRS